MATNEKQTKFTKNYIVPPESIPPVKTMTVELTFFTPLLATAPNDPELYDRFVASKAPEGVNTADEIAALGVGAVEDRDRGMTVFLKERLDDDAEPIPYILPYHFKGFLKDSARAIAKIPKTKIHGMKAYIKTIERHIFIRQLKLAIRFEGEIGTCQRSLRANGPQGERTALASSEMIGSDAKISFTADLFTQDAVDLFKECLDYGRLSGIGQWRNGGNGRFEWRVCREE